MNQPNRTDENAAYKPLLLEQVMIEQNNRHVPGCPTRGDSRSGVLRRYRGLGENLTSKWRYLAVQESFKRTPVRTLSRLVSWRARCFVGSSAVVHMPRWNVQMLLPANWHGVEKLIFAFREYYESELGYLEQILSPGMTFVDAGACYGIYSLAASKIVGPEGRVLAFEPASRVFSVLERNVALSHLQNARAHRVALTDKPGRAWLYHHANVGCDSLGRDHTFTEKKEEIDTEMLDHMLRGDSAGPVHVIKMDVQGAEELVLRGAASTIKTQHPVVIFEVYPEGAAALGLSLYGAWDFLDRAGYEFFVVNGSGALQPETSPPSNRNVIAIYRCR